MAQRKPLTATQKELKLVQQQIRRLEKRGYTFTEESKKEVAKSPYQTLHSLRSKNYSKLIARAATIPAKEPTLKKQVPKKKPLTETQKIRKLVQQQVRRMESRGYTVGPETKDLISRAKYSTLKSLQAAGYKKLYDKATAQAGGETVSGTQKRHMERFGPEPAREEPVSASRSFDFSGGGTDWESARRDQDAREREDALRFNAGKIVYDNLLETIDFFPTQGAEYLKRELQREIERYGFDAVMQAMSVLPADVIESAQEVIYYESEPGIMSHAIQNFSAAITGVIASTEDARTLGDVMEVL